ncbi:MAG: DUF935 family protein [Bacteroidetes bacterium]|nr:DUF935 family protein [Bacteroidota bacterium]
MSDTLPTFDKDLKVKDPIAPAGVLATRRRAQPTLGLLSISRILPNPDSIMRRAGRDPIPAYREIEEDTNVSACIRSRKSAVKKLVPTVDYDRPQTSYTEFARDVLQGLPLRDIIGNILDAPMYGYSVLEVLWRVVNGRMMPVAVVDRPQEWFAFDEFGQCRFMATGVKDGEPLMNRKFLIVRHEATTNKPYGQPILSNCFWPVSFKKSGYKLYLRYIDKYGIPFLVGKSGRDASDQERDELLDLLEEARQDGVAVVPEGTNVESLDLTGSSSSALFTGLRQSCKEDIVEAILGHIGATQQTAGQLGQNDTALQVRQDIIDADRAMVEDVINKLIRWAIDANFYSDDYPVFSLEEPVKVRKELADRDKTLLDGKTFTFTKSYYLRAYNFKDTDIVMLNRPDVPAPEPTPAPVAAVPPVAPQTSVKAPAFDETPKAGQTHTIAQKAIDDHVTAALAGASSNEALDAMLQPVVEKILAAASFTEVTDLLQTMFGEMSSEAFTENLARALFMADTVGRLEMEETLRLKGGHQ